MSAADSQVRVKVYYLEDGSNWADRGTGFCTLEDCQGELHLSVVSENEPNRAILDCVVQRGEVYQQQESTLIVWTEPTGEDLALSFQEQEGCMSILNQIAEFENATKEHALGRSPTTREAFLPQPTLNSLGEIERLICEASQSLFQRDRLISFILKDAYLAQLQSLHETCEDLDATEELHTLYNIARCIVLLNDSSVLEQIIRDDNIIGFVGMLEYDPRNPVERGTYREFLRSDSHYKEAVPIGDPTTEARIHQNFRLQYLKDVVLPGVMDDGTLPVVNALIFFNNAQITSYLQNNESLLKDLFDILHESNDIDRKRNVVLFVRQFSGMTKTLPAVYRVGLYRTLSQHGLFYVFEYALQEADKLLQIAAAEVLLSVLEQDRALVRSYILAQMRQDRESATLLSLVIRCTKQAIGSEIQLQCCEILRIVLDSMPPPADAFDMSTSIGVGGQASNESDDFLGMFYELYARSTMELLLSTTAKEVEGLGARDKRSALYVFLCELLSSMVRFHGHRARSFTISSGIFDSVCLLFSAKHNFLKLAALRFFRTCIGLQDDVYNKYLTSNHLLAPIVELFIGISPRDNLLTSACRELFAFVASHRIPALLSHLLGAHSKALEQVPVILDNLRQAYNDHLLSLEQIKSGGMSTPIVDTSRRSALSINMLVARESAIHGALSMPNANGSGPWGSHAVDDIEDAYLEASGEDSDLVDDDDDVEGLAKITRKLARVEPIGEGKRLKSTPKQSPELEVLQDCLEQYSSNSESKPLSVEELVVSSSPLSLSMNGDDVEMLELLDQSPDNSAGALLRAKSKSPVAAPPPLKRHGSSSCDLTANGVASVSEAFPDRQPISRKLSSKLSSKRQIAGRASASPYHRSFSSPACQLNGTASRQTQNGSSDREQAPALAGVVHIALALEKRRKSFGSARRPGITDDASLLPQSGKLSLQMVHSKIQQQHHQRFTNGGSSDRLAIDRRAEDSPGVRRSTVSCSQSSSPISLMSGSPTEGQSPPKKAKTASL